MQKRSLPNCLRTAAAVLIAAAAPACGAREEGSSSILFFAAASTQDAVREISTRFEAETQVPVTLNFAASSTLAQQILAGAGGDLFLSANVHWVEEVMAEGLASSRRDLLGNRLVVIAPAESGLQLRKASDLLGSTIARLSLADPEGVPAGDLRPGCTAETRPVEVPPIQGGARFRRAPGPVLRGAGRSGGGHRLFLRSAHLGGGATAPGTRLRLDPAHRVPPGPLEISRRGGQAFLRIPLLPGIR